MSEKNDSVLEIGRTDRTESMASLFRTNTFTLKHTEIYFLIFIFSLALRLIKLIVDPVLMRDSALYLSLAQEWIDKGGFNNAEFNIPLLPICTLKIASSFWGDVETVGRSISLFLGSLIPVLGYVISEHTFLDKKKSLICAIILMIHPNLISYSIQPLRETPYLFFECLVILEAVKGIKNQNTTSWLLCGLFSALAFYCRLEALESVFIFPLIIVLFCVKKLLTINKASIYMGLFILSFLLSIFTIALISDMNLSFVQRLFFYLKQL